MYLAAPATHELVKKEAELEDSVKKTRKYHINRQAVACYYFKHISHAGDGLTIYVFSQIQNKFNTNSQWEAGIQQIYSPGSLH